MTSPSNTAQSSPGDATAQARPQKRTVSIHDILAELRAAAWDERDKGDRFERLMVAFFKTDPVYSAKYSDVWKWIDWPDRPPKSDVGIDLVAVERDTDECCAIQCKFIDPDHRLEKADIDSFFTASGKAPFTSRIIVSTTDHWGKNAEDALHNQQIPVARIGIPDLESSSIDWSAFSLATPETMERKEQKKLRPYQQLAVDKVVAGLHTADRGKLIMACGTGKTFTSLKIAERMVPSGGSVLFLAPSISLVGQTLKEWASEAKTPLRTFAVCSDPRAGKRTESEDIGAYDLAFPASTSAAKLVEQAGASHDGTAITVIYSTYQSLAVINQAQQSGLPEFDLVICDEAHRTTGVTLADDDESAFVRIHDSDFVKGAKRLYMTATPRIYTDASKTAAKEGDAVLASMDDEAVFGTELHRLGFGEAVGKGLLADYKVLVLAVDEAHVSRVMQSQLAKDRELNLDDAAKIIGCWNGLAKRGISDETFAVDPNAMHRAVAFSRSIKDSKRFQERFSEIVNAYVSGSVDDDTLSCRVEHVDGHDNALVRAERLEWLKGQMTSARACRILSNAKCLSEGVDVPALDAVLFLNPRNSPVDVVQSVGRVMRLAEGKKYGYIILPIGVPADTSPEEALRDNKKYKVVWDVLQALRAHDDRFNALVNKIELNKTRPDQLQVIGVGGYGDASERSAAKQADPQLAMPFPHIAEWRDAIYAKALQKVGERRYWEQWAQDIAQIAARHTTRIQTILEPSGTPIRKKFDKFVAGLRKTLNPSISDDGAIHMLSQHLITKPVFDALFGDYEFAKTNPISIAMQKMIDALEPQNLDAETETLDRFYDSVRTRAEGIDNAAGRQQIIADLYEKFFKAAFPDVAQSLGIVYTPVEVVDFIIRSVAHVLEEEFEASLGDDGVHILDPFTGTGTFIVRLLQSGLIEPDQLARKYVSELHANEIVLLAYYIAAINIEAAFHDIVPGDYKPFEGIVLTDTFQMYESDGVLDEDVFYPNSARGNRQKKVDIRVIIGNPPYSVGQGSENDANKNIKYRALDERIRGTYAARSSAGLKRNLYDSYIRAFRYASDRIKDRGIVCFVTNGAFIDAASADGFRKSVMDEFSSVYCLNLRGAIRGRSRSAAKAEGGNVFDIMTGVAITILVKNPAHAKPCDLQYHDIGDHLSREQKLSALRSFRCLEGIPWDRPVPDAAGDWINLRDSLFGSFAVLGEKAKMGGVSRGIFDIYSLGVVTNRDSWAYNFDRSALVNNMERMIAAFNDHVTRFESWAQEHGENRTADAVNRFVDTDSAKISWTVNLKEDVRKSRVAHLDRARAVPSMYRPFCKQWLYFDRRFNERVYLQPKLFPTPEHHNRVIAVSGVGAGTGYSVLMTDALPCLHLAGAGNAVQCFPRFRYELADGSGLFSEVPDPSGYVRRDAISDGMLAAYRQRDGEDTSNDDIFYYVYGILHSPEYQSRFASDLGKMIPRIPMVEDFAAFSTAGRELAKWHLGYETVEPWPVTGMSTSTAIDMRVTKMRFGKSGGKDDKTTIVVNSAITLSDIPLEAYEYEVNGKSAIEWIMDRYQVKTDKDSGIVNDPNMWSEDPRYIVDLVARIVRVSMETVDIVRSLPALGI